MDKIPKDFKAIMTEERYRELKDKYFNIPYEQLPPEIQAEVEPLMLKLDEDDKARAKKKRNISKVWIAISKYEWKEKRNVTEHYCLEDLDIISQKGFIQTWSKEKLEEIMIELCSTLNRIGKEYDIMEEGYQNQSTQSNNKS